MDELWAPEGVVTCTHPGHAPLNGREDIMASWQSILGAGAGMSTRTLTPTNPDPNPDQLEMVGFVPVLLYFGYMMMVSLLFFLGAGTIGFLSSWWFVWKIYGAVKVD